MGYIKSVETMTYQMFVTDQYITFTYAISTEGVDYGTGYYLTQEYSNGGMDYFGPYDYEEDARSVISDTPRIF